MLVLNDTTAHTTLRSLFIIARVLINNILVFKASVNDRILVIMALATHSNAQAVIFSTQTLHSKDLLTLMGAMRLRLRLINFRFTFL